MRDFAAPGFIMCITYSLSMGLCTLQTMMELEDKVTLRLFLGSFWLNKFECKFFEF